MECSVCQSQVACNRDEFKTCNYTSLSDIQNTMTVGAVLKFKESRKMSMLNIIQKARIAGMNAASRQYIKLQKAGPQWEVKDYFTGKSVGTMLDVCGFANINIKISGNDKRWQELKRLAENNANRIMCHSTGSIKSLTIFDMTMRQEMSVNEAANEAAAEVLESYGFDCRMTSRID